MRPRKPATSATKLHLFYTAKSLVILGRRLCDSGAEWVQCEAGHQAAVLHGLLCGSRHSGGARICKVSAACGAKKRGGEEQPRPRVNSPRKGGSSCPHHPLLRYEAVNELLLAGVSGGFVYIATMTVMPELLDDSDEHVSSARPCRCTLPRPAVSVSAARLRLVLSPTAQGKPPGGLLAALKETLVQLAAFGAGVFMMVLVAQLEVHDH